MKKVGFGCLQPLILSDAFFHCFQLLLSRAERLEECSVKLEITWAAILWWHIAVSGRELVTLIQKKMFSVWKYNSLRLNGQSLLLILQMPWRFHVVPVLNQNQPVLMVVYKDHSLAKIFTICVTLPIGVTDIRFTLDVTGPATTFATITYTWPQVMFDIQGLFASAI